MAVLLFGGLHHQIPKAITVLAMVRRCELAQLVLWHNQGEWALSEAEKSASVTHNHPEGIKGAQAVALAIYLARQGASKDEIREQLTLQIGYDLSRSYEDIQPTYTFDVTCQGSVPESIIAFLASENYEDAIRKAIWLGGDADTMACISGGIAEAYYGEIPEYLMDEAMKKLPQQFKDIITAFYQAI